MGSLIRIMAISLGMLWLAAAAMNGAWEYAVEDQPVPAIASTQSPAELFVMDWDGGVAYRVRMADRLLCSPQPAMPISRETLSKLTILQADRLNANDYRYLLRDCETGQIRPASGLWCWPALDGVSANRIYRWKIIDVFSAGE